MDEPLKKHLQGSMTSTTKGLARPGSAAILRGETPGPAGFAFDRSPLLKSRHFAAQTPGLAGGHAIF
jgi:hypothetical protein